MSSSRLPRLYSYCIPFDDGAAPNPFWGKCTLAICKPAIRRTATKGDWIVGTGSKRSPAGDLSGRVVYVMKVSKVLSMREYDDWVRKNLREKIPDPDHHDVRRRLGDSIYDFSKKSIGQRPGVHNAKNRKTDLSGKNVLVSNHFYYFGKSARKLPPELRSIAHQKQGHRVRLNTEYMRPFLKWLRGSNLKRNKLYDKPASSLMTTGPRSAAKERQICALKDNRCINRC